MHIPPARKRKKKTYNNIVSALRAAFSFGYKDHPQRFNPGLGLRTLRISKKDRPAVDPYSIHEAEQIIESSHRMFGEIHGNYEEFRFFTGLRQSEQIALTIADHDSANGTLMINKARVLGRDKNRTKTNQDRVIKLFPRAAAVFNRQLALRNTLVAAGKISHPFVFFCNSRRSCISWRLMLGHNRLLVAQDDGHSVETMERTYAAWTKGAGPAEVELIRRAMGFSNQDRDSVSQLGDQSRLQALLSNTTDIQTLIA